MMIRRFFSILTMVSLAANANAEGSVAVKINKAMVVNETGSGDAMLWFDEQTAASAPTTRWKTSGNTACWPAGLVLDLGREYEIESIRLFDMEKAYRAEGGRLEIATGRPFEWNVAAAPEMKNEGRWVDVKINRRTQYLHLVKQATVMCNLDGQYPENCDVNIGEVIIIGKPVGKVHKTKKPHGKRPKPVTMDRFIGMNSYIDTDERLYDAVGTVREYRPWRWNGVDDVSKPISWEPMKVGDGDKYYAHMHQLGIDCMPCIHRHVLNSASEQIPSFGADPNIPETYRLMADYSFQFVARYGSTHVAERLLRTTEPSPKKSGLGYIRYFENWNEQNREWGDPTCHFTPYMFAAFSSASYDGHLSTMGEGIGVPVYSEDGVQDPIGIAQRAVAKAKTEGFGVVIVDTAGRLAVDQELMDEISALHQALRPTESLFVVDAMTGQDAVETAKVFNERLDFDGVVLTKMDGDTRGGAALSIKYVTGKPLKFISSGEKMETMDIFHPDRIADRILGMGDVVSLVERAQEQFDEKQARETRKKLARDKFGLMDFYNQIQQVKKMGNIKDLASMIPGVGKALKDVDIDNDKAFKGIEAIILSMTPAERDNPDIINGSRRKRIADGSGTSVAEVNKLLKQFEGTRKMMKSAVTGNMMQRLRGMRR